MKKSLKYRLYPTKKQRRLLQEQLDECRWLYNRFLEERKNSWERDKKGIGYFQQCKSIVTLKKERPSLNKVYSQVLQNVADRIDKAFQNFFRRVKQGQKPGYPRFKGFDRYDSFTYKQVDFGWEIIDNHLNLSKTPPVAKKQRCLNRFIHTAIGFPRMKTLFTRKHHRVSDKYENRI